MTLKYEIKVASWPGLFTGANYTVQFESLWCCAVNFGSGKSLPRNWCKTLSNKFIETYTFTFE